MPSFNELRDRIGGVRNIQQITRAMKMVAGARLRRAEEAILALRPFASRLDGMCARFLQDATGAENRFFEQRSSTRLAVLSIASDRGLCGSYNNRIVEAAAELIGEHPDGEPLVLSVGKRGTDRLRVTGMAPRRSFEDAFNPVQFSTAQEIGSELQDAFLSGEADEVQVVFAEYFSPLRQLVTNRQILPCSPDILSRHIRREAGRELPEGVTDEVESIERAARSVYIYEPDYDDICDGLLRHNINVQVYRALLEAQASEHGARMMAMDNATENADEMIDELTLTMNRLRQEDITKEIIDVVGGAEAMK